MIAVSKKTRIITRSRYSAPSYRGKENAMIIEMGSACVSRAGFGVAPKQSFL
jgi:hypothetical protein